MADNEKTTTEQLQELKERLAAQMQADAERRAASGLTVNLGLTEAEQEDIAAKYSPELDPYSADFDIEKYAAANGGAKELLRAIDQTKQEMASGFNGKFKPATGDSASDLQAIRFIHSARSFFSYFVEHPEIIDSIKRFSRLSDLIEKEILKPEYGGKSFEDLYREGHNEADEIIPGSLWEQAETAARRALKKADELTAGRRAAATEKKAAAEQGAVMELKGGYYPIFSAQDLWDAFAPGKICEMGTLDKSWIDPTGRINKTEFSPGEIVELDKLGATYNAFMLLSAIIANTTDNLFETEVKEGVIKFSVKGILKSISTDTRYLISPDQLDNDQLTIDRKTAGVLFLEDLFKPLQNYIGKMPNGSRYSVFNYIGYDADADTMEISTPYIYQLWRRTQNDYFNRRAALQEAQAANKKPNRDDTKPLEINRLFKNKAISTDPITLEIAVCITNILFTAGTEKQGSYKENRTTFNKIINQCPTLKQRIAELEKGEKSNPAALINNELRKFKVAYKLIMDSSKCDATTEFEFLEIEPVKKNGQTDPAKWEFIAPTKSKLKDEIYIKWRHKKTPAAIGGKN